MSEGERDSGGIPGAPGFAVLSRQGELRETDARLLEYLGLGQAPEGVRSVEQLLGAAGFHPRPGQEGFWEREGRVLQAGESLREDGSLLMWAQPIPWDEEGAQRRARYLGLASHDLRGALANVRSYAALLLNGRIPLEPKAKRGLETILRNTDKALSFSQDFFDSSRADLGKLAYEKERQALEPLVSEVVERHQELASAASVALLVEPGGPLPEVDMDAGRVQHAVESFLRHQLLRAQPGEQVRVRMGTDGGGQVRVEVRRDGVPLAHEEAALLFTREERAFREKKLEDALRLRLALQEVETLGGSVGVVTDEGGTTLYLTLPPALPADDQPSSSLS